MGGDWNLSLPNQDARLDRFFLVEAVQPRIWSGVVRVEDRDVDALGPEAVADQAGAQRTEND